MQEICTFGKHRRCVVFILFFIIISIVYSNSIHASWHLDDYHAILSNSKIHLNHFSFQSISDTFFSNPNHQRLSRPISYLSFAINWYFGKSHVEGYHVINILLHILCAWFLFLTIQKLFLTPNSQKRDLNDVSFIAALSAALWAINPIQTQAVTYIVQRMAVMASLFYIIGIFFYLRARLTQYSNYRILFFLACATSYLLALGSKENAVLLPVTLIFLEIIFFKDHAKIWQFPKKSVCIGFTALIIIAGCCFLYFYTGNTFQVLSELYKNKPFTVWERLMTEARVITYYLTQIFYPAPTRLSLIHDFPLSRSLFYPISTLPSVFAVLFLLLGSLFIVKKNPLISFSLLFFLINHLTESSIIPLAPAFEHRNYLPSMFLFLPIAMGLLKFINYYDYQNFRMHLIMIGALVLLIIFWGTGTRMRNLAWHSEKRLWNDTIQKAPNSQLAYHNLAWTGYAKKGHFDKAINLYKHALRITDPEDNYNAVLFTHLARLYSHKGMHAMALKFSENAYSLQPNNNKVFEQYILDHLNNGNYKIAADLLKPVTKRCTPKNLKYIKLKAMILIKENRLAQAIHCLRQTLPIHPKDWSVYLNLGFAITLQKDYERGFWYFKEAMRLNRHKPLTLLAAAENRLRADKAAEAALFIKKFIDISGISQVDQKLKAMKEDFYTPPLAYTMLIPLIHKSIETQASELANILSVND